MGKVKGKHRLDKYYHLAKEHGYRSRAAWKLVQLESKFSFLRSAPPCSTSVPRRRMDAGLRRARPVGSLVVGVDLDPHTTHSRRVALQEDITEPKCRAAVKRIMSENGCRAFDLVLHDGSPNVGGAWAKEATSQNALVIDSVKLATELLAPKGTFVTKVFRSQDYTAVLYCLRQLFEKVEVDKPQASRSTSAEIYLIGFKYKAPAKIDPRLLDVKHLFQGGKEPPKVIDVLRGTKQKRHRDGCALMSILSYLLLLASVLLYSDPACLSIKDHTLTTEEVKALCEDLRVLGKQDFKHLLKWRILMRKALSPEKATSTTTIVEHESKEDEDERVLTEMEELTNAMERKKKRAKETCNKKTSKGLSCTVVSLSHLLIVVPSQLAVVCQCWKKLWKALGKQTDVIEDGYTDMELFSIFHEGTLLSLLFCFLFEGKKDLVAVDNNEYDDDAGGIGNSESEESHDEDEENTESDLDSEEERKRYDERVEKLLDEAYEHFVAKKEGSTMQRKRSKQAYSKDDKLWRATIIIYEHEELEKDDSDDEMHLERPVENPRISLEEPVPQKKITKLPSVQSSRNVDSGFEIVPAPATDSSDSSSSDDSGRDDIQTKAEILACEKDAKQKAERTNA
ncbi:hypothetical protein DH2020_044812 [Rehmannia glutinosa]|uniref:Ribosomal RNA methyltransferase FtsJ domain-containing protein n=1 Tax=Rehmannia glutinosa TaxID=99300 RepID=A0ABR0UHG2_REHGL